MLMFSSEFVGRDRPRQLALNGSTTEYQLKNVAHDTEYVLTLYVLFGSVVGPGISATFRTCEYLLLAALPLTSSTVHLFSCSSRGDSSHLYQNYHASQKSQNI